MAERIYLAHLAKDGRKQTVQEHLRGTAEKCSDFAGSFGAEKQGELAGLTHDAGKSTDGFQRRILQDGPRVDHSTAGAFECMKRGQLFAAFAVAGHHGGLPDGGGRGDGPDAGTFFGRIKRAAEGGLENYDAWQEGLTLPDLAVPPDYATKDRLAGMFFTRMLFSCLVDADYADTAAFMDGRPPRFENADGMETLWARLQAYISAWFPPRGELNARRCAILETCMREGQRRAPGLYTLTVPTGGGKTVASLAFALAQAKARGLKRVVYVIPYTSIIEQTAATFREILGKNNVLEHHSGAAFDLEENEASTPETERFTRASETWDAPVVVTTAVQFFESLFSCKPSRCRKLHNLAQSAIIFDEAQMLPLPYLRPCVWAIAQLARHYGVSAVLCTATQPALCPIIRAFAPELAQEELCPMAAADWDAFRRVTFRRAGRRTWAALAGELQAREQALCVVNTRKAARDVFEKLSGEGNFHLSTLMIPAHRRAVLDEARRRLQRGAALPRRLHLADRGRGGRGLPGGLPRGGGAGFAVAGRGTLQPRREAQTGRKRRHALPRAKGARRAFSRLPSARGGWCWSASRTSPPARPSTPTSAPCWTLKGEEAQDIHGILPLMESEFFPFRAVSERFHLIDSPTVTVYVPIGEGKDARGAPARRRGRAGALPRVGTVRRIRLRAASGGAGSGGRGRAAGGWLVRAGRCAAIFGQNGVGTGSEERRGAICLISY